MIIIDVDLDGKVLQVVRQGEGGPPAYDVIVDGTVRHPNCSAEDAMRAMGNYIHSLSHNLQIRTTIAEQAMKDSK